LAATAPSSCREGTWTGPGRLLFQVLSLPPKDLIRERDFSAPWAACLEATEKELLTAMTAWRSSCCAVLLPPSQLHGGHGLPWQVSCTTDATVSKVSTNGARVFCYLRGSGSVGRPSCACSLDCAWKSIKKRSETVSVRYGKIPPSLSATLALAELAKRRSPLRGPDLPPVGFCRGDEINLPSAISRPSRGGKSFCTSQLAILAGLFAPLFDKYAHAPFWRGCAESSHTSYPFAA
jgi:hypothetical protein